MSKIKILPSELISQIAAGEVIERPASCLKELVENSVDSGATWVTVEVSGGGLQKIRVVDNGAGMSPEDAPLAFARHATSKISRLEDLFQIESLGFRGEALASIASIAKVVMKTRPQSERIGCLVEIDGGKELRCEETACDRGTDITVFGLFSHTPARKKFMKSEATEYGHILDMVTKIALAHPQIGFRLVKDEKLVFESPAGQSLKERLRGLFGGQTAEALIPVTYDQINLILRGFVGKPELARSSKKYQFCFVNGRSIDSRIVGKAVKEAFHSLLMHEKYPWFILDMTIDPTLVDVNVHPRKLEVKFLNSQEVYRVIFGAVHHALQANLLSPVLGEKTTSGLKPGIKPMTPLSFELPEREVRSLERKEEPIFDLKGLLLRPLAQLAQSYILAESEEGLVLIDQHAAHERVRYAKLMQALKVKKVEKQALLSPLELDLGKAELRLLEANLGDFEALGFEIEPFGGSTYLLRAVPSGLEKREPERILKEILSDLASEMRQNQLKNIQEALLTMTACRGAIKFGDLLTMAEMTALVSQMEKTPNFSHCPHGRPAIITFSFDKLESLFKRKNF